RRRCSAWTAMAPAPAAARRARGSSPRVADSETGWFRDRLPHRSGSRVGQSRGGSVRVRGAVAWGAAASLLLALSGCSLLDGDDPETEPPSSGPTDGQGEHPSGQPTIPPQLLECGDPAGKGGDSEETEGDDPVELTDALVASDASWDVPAGYESATGYYDDLDYEQRMFMHTYVP